MAKITIEINSCEECPNGLIEPSYGGKTVTCSKTRKEVREESLNPHPPFIRVPTWCPCRAE